MGEFLDEFRKGSEAGKEAARAHKAGEPLSYEDADRLGCIGFVFAIGASLFAFYQSWQTFGLGVLLSVAVAVVSWFASMFLFGLFIAIPPLVSNRSHESVTSDEEDDHLSDSQRPNS